MLMLCSAQQLDLQQARRRPRRARLLAEDADLFMYSAQVFLRPSVIMHLLPPQHTRPSVSGRQRRAFFFEQAGTALGPPGIGSAFFFFGFISSAWFSVVQGGSGRVPSSSPSTLPASKT